MKKKLKMHFLFHVPQNVTIKCKSKTLICIIPGFIAEQIDKKEKKKRKHKFPARHFLTVKYLLIKCIKNSQKFLSKGCIIFPLTLVNCIASSELSYHVLYSCCNWFKREIFWERSPFFFSRQKKLLIHKKILFFQKR